MKAWRERTAEARERGAFTREDMDALVSPRTCPVGECALRLDESHHTYWWRLAGASNQDVDDRQLRILIAISANKFDVLEAELDWLDDRTLALKREEIA